MKGDPCVHCKFRKAWRARGLCNECYENTDIRAQHPPRHKQQARDLDNATESELDALIDSRRPTMPEERYEMPERSPLSPIEERAMVRRSRMGRV